MSQGSWSGKIEKLVTKPGAIALLGVGLMVAAPGCLQPGSKTFNGDSASTTNYSVLPSPSPSPTVWVSPSPSPSPSAIPSPMPMSILPNGGSYGLGTSVTFSVTGGIGPFVYTVRSGMGVVDPLTGVYKSGYTPGPAHVQVTDSMGDTVGTDIMVVINAPVKPNDQYFQSDTSGNPATSLQWPFWSNWINAQGAWGFETDCSSTLVAVIDTGIDLTHPDLAPNIYTNAAEQGQDPTIDHDGNGFPGDVHGWNFASGDNHGGSPNVMDDNYHGTHVAGVIAAVGNNQQGVAGLCWKAQLLPIKAFDQNGAGYASDAAAAIEYALTMHSRIIHMSGSFGSNSAVLNTAVQRATTLGVLLVTGAGNSSNNNDANPVYPVSYNYPNILSVAATSKGTLPDLSGKAQGEALSYYSNYGATSVLLAAPGDGVMSTFPTTVTAAMGALGGAYTQTYYNQISGTSVAAAMVTGSAALIESFYPGASYQEVRSRLLQRSDIVNSLNGRVWSSGRLNIRNSIYY